jgi:chemosensory pili system protein ChpC
VAILTALSGHARLPYFGVLCQGFPRLTLISEKMLVADDASGAVLTGVREQVRVHDESAWIPDLGAIEGLAVDILAAAA